jgi:hypothetical protein
MRPSLAIASVLLGALAAQKPEPEPDPYPPQRPSSHVLFFMLAGELKAEPLRKALSELSTKEAECKLVFGPRKADARPGAQFVAVEAPAALGVKELGAALRKGCAAADPLCVTLFHGANEGPGSDAEAAGFFGMGMRDFVLGMSGDIRWYDALGGWRQFYFGAGKIGSKEIADRYAKLFGPVGGKPVGEVVRESLRWTLAEPLDPKAAGRAEKSIAKRPGVVRCSIDAGQRLLSVEFRLEELKSAAAAPGPRAAADKPVAPRAHFDTLALFEVLDKEKLALAPAAGGK